MKGGQIGINTIQGNGFTVQKTIFDNYTISFEGTEVAYVKEQENGLYQCACFLRYPSSFGQFTPNKSMDEVIEILNSIVANNFKFEKESQIEQLTLF